MLRGLTFHSSSGGGVTSFATRTGDVIPEVGDYSAFYGQLDAPNQWNDFNIFFRDDGGTGVATTPYPFENLVVENSGPAAMGIYTSDPIIGQTSSLFMGDMQAQDFDGTLAQAQISVYTSNSGDLGYTYWNLDFVERNPSDGTIVQSVPGIQVQYWPLGGEIVNISLEGPSSFADIVLAEGSIILNDGSSFLISTLTQPFNNNADMMLGQVTEGAVNSNIYLSCGADFGGLFQGAAGNVYIASSLGGIAGNAVVGGTLDIGEGGVSGWTGTAMASISGVDGSMQLAGGNFSISSGGNFNANAGVFSGEIFFENSVTTIAGNALDDGFGNASFTGNVFLDAELVLGGQLIDGLGNAGASGNLLTTNGSIIFWQDPSLIPGTVRLLATSGGINAKTVANTGLYTVPAGKKAVITSAYVRCSAATAITAGPTAGIGNVAGTNNIFPSTAMTALTTTSSIFGFSLIGVSLVTAAGATIYFNLGTAATGTSETIIIELEGYLV